MSRICTALLNDTTSTLKLAPRQDHVKTPAGLKGLHGSGNFYPSCLAENVQSGAYPAFPSYGTADAFSVLVGDNQAKEVDYA